MKIKRDYQNKKFTNPYFKKAEKPSGFNTKLYLKICLVVLIIYVIIYSDLFKINKIEVWGTDMISQEELTRLVEEKINVWRYYLWPQNNFLLLSSNYLEEGINDNYNLKTVIIEKGWKSLSVGIEEKISYLIIFNLENNLFYFTDIAGVVMYEIPKEKIGEYWERFPILNISQPEIEIGKQVITSKIVNFILELSEAVKKKLINVQGYEKRGVDEIALVSRDGWRAYFDINSDINIAVDNLSLILAEKIKNPKKVEYIDLRFGNKVFYK